MCPPDTDVTGLEKVQQLFHHTFASIRDATISYIKELMVEEEESSPSSDNSDIADESNIEDESNIAEASTTSEETNDRLILNLIIMIYTPNCISQP